VSPQSSGRRTDVRRRANVRALSVLVTPASAKSSASIISLQAMDDGFPADLVAADGLSAGLGGGAADERSAGRGGGPGVAIRASLPDHPSPGRASNESRTGTSRGRAIRGSTNSSGDHPT
jgi:hypothetical protein